MNFYQFKNKIPFWVEFTLTGPHQNKPSLANGIKLGRWWFWKMSQYAYNVPSTHANQIDQWEWGLLKCEVQWSSVLCVHLGRVRVVIFRGCGGGAAIQLTSAFNLYLPHILQFGGCRRNTCPYWKNWAQGPLDATALLRRMALLIPAKQRSPSKQI